MGIIFNIFSEMSCGRRISKCSFCLSLLRCSVGMVQLLIEEAPVDGAQEYTDFYSDSVGPVNLCTQLCVSSFLHNLQSVLKRGQISREILYILCILYIINNVWNLLGHDLPKRGFSAILSSFCQV